MENKLLTFVKPYLTFIDNGNFFRKPFYWLYIILAILNVIFPFYLLYGAIESRVFSAPASFIFAFILIWLSVLVAAWLGAQIWWDRKDKVADVSKKDDDFQAIPTFSHFIQTLGEWLGMWIAIIGTWSTLITMIFSSDILLYRLNLDVAGTGIMAVLLCPVVGFLVVVATRVLAELIRALASIANNTKK